MLLRIEGMYSMFTPRQWAPIGLGILLFIQAAVNAWLLSHGQRAFPRLYSRFQ
jgi:hypothetical protein